MRPRWFLLLIIFNSVVEVLTSKIKQEKQIKGKMTGKEEINHKYLQIT